MFDEIKFRELVLHIAQKSVDDPRFGTVKLNKILYYADFEAYRRLSQPITGATYHKLSEGPAPSQMLAQREILMDSGDIAMAYAPYFTGVQQRIVACRSPRSDLFTPDELDIVDEAIEAMWHMTAREASDFSHRELGWLAAAPGEEIPYETAWLSPDPVPQEVEERAAEVAASLGRR